MDIWSILGIEETKSEQEIVEAYRKMLVQNNPEENQEGFMQLRSAYEQALSFSKSSQYNFFEPLLEQATRIYENMHSRMDQAKWLELLEDPVVQQLDTRGEAENQLILFLMEHYRLSKEVFSIFVKEFGWDHKREDLSAHYPPGFINYVFDVVSNGEYYKLSYFDGDDYAPYDEFIEKSMDFVDKIIEDPESAKALMAELDAMEIYHPYYIEDKIRLYNLLGEYEESERLTTDFAALYPTDERLLSLRLNVLSRVEGYEEGEQIAEILRSMNPKNRALLLFDILVLGQKDLIKAKDQYYDFNREYSYGEDSEGIAKVLNKNLVPYLEAKGEALEQMERLTLAWAYYEGDDLERAYTYLDTFEPEDAKVGIKYHKIKGFLSVQTNRFQEAIENISQWETLKEAENMQNQNDPEATSESLNRVNNDLQELLAMYHSKFRAYMALLDEENAEKYLDKIIQVQPLDLDAFILKSNLLMDQGRYEEIVQLNTAAMKENGDTGVLLYLTGVAEFKMEHYADSMRYFDMAKEHMPQWNIIEHYRLLMLDGWNFVNEYEQTLNYLKSGAVEPLSPKMMELYEIKLLRMQNHFGEARSRIENLIEKMDEGDQVLGDEEKGLIYQEASTIYRELKSYMDALANIEKAQFLSPLNRSMELDKGYILVLLERFEDALRFYENLVSKYPNETVYYIRLAATKFRAGGAEEAIATYEKALAIDPTRYDIYSYISDIYEAMGNDEKTLEYKSLAIQYEPTFENYYDRAGEYYRQVKLPEAIADLNAAKEFEPYNSDILTFLGICYMKLNDYLAAQEHYEKAMAYFNPDSYSLNTPMYLTIKYFREKRYDAVVETLNKGFELLGDDQGGWATLRLGEALAQLGKIDEAQAVYQKALSADGDNPNVHYEYAVFLYKTNRPQEGLKHLKSLGKAMENNPYYFSNLGLYSYMYLLDFDVAEQYYYKAKEILGDSDDWSLINLYETIWYSLRTAKGVLSDELKAKKGLLVGSKTKKMQHYFEKRIKQNEAHLARFGQYEYQNSAHEMSLLAEAYFYSGDLELAEKVASLALAVPIEDYSLVQVPTDAEYILGMVYEAKGDLQTALSYYQRAVDTRWGFALFDEAVKRVERKMKMQ